MKINLVLHSGKTENKVSLIPGDPNSEAVFPHSTSRCRVSG